MADIKLIPRDNNEKSWELIKDVARRLTAEDIVIVDEDILKSVLNRYSKECKRVQYCSRASIKEFVRELKPTIVVMFFNTERTISDLK